ncbi:MAG TPA: helix-turn-helix domain-containing protein [Polyangia bacterium]|nr:helix-turn-helix domain-containing protein [Polyangia bacterium]
MANEKAPSTEHQEGLWDANDVAQFLKVSRSWVYQRAESGTIACLRVGGLIRFDPEVVRAFARGERGSSKVLPFSACPSRKSG